MASPHGQTSYQHNDYKVQREFERIGRKVASIEKATQMPTVQSSGGGSTQTPPQQEIYTYNAYWEETELHAADIELEFETNRDWEGGWIPVSVHNAIPDVIYDNELWGNWIANKRYTIPSAYDAKSVVPRTKDLFYFYPNKAGSYNVTCKVLLDIFNQLMSTTCITGISNMILIMLKDTYANLVQYDYYNPIYRGTIVTGPPDILNPIVPTSATYSILDVKYRYNQSWIDNIDCPQDSTKVQLEALNQLFMRPKILVEGSTNVYMDLGDVITFWYKFSSSSATGGGIDFQNVQYDTIGVRRMIERINISWSGDKSWDNNARPNLTLEEFIKNYDK